MPPELVVELELLRSSRRQSSPDASESALQLPAWGRQKDADLRRGWNPVSPSGLDRCSPILTCFQADRNSWSSPNNFFLHPRHLTEKPVHRPHPLEHPCLPQPLHTLYTQKLAQPAGFMMSMSRPRAAASLTSWFGLFFLFLFTDKAAHAEQHTTP